jgi:hypothetical protein
MRGSRRVTHNDRLVQIPLQAPARPRNIEINSQEHRAPDISVKAPRWLSAIKSQIDGRGLETAGVADRRLLDRPTREDILQGFRLILGRELTDESAITAQLGHRSIAEFRLSLLNSTEFQGKFKLIRPGPRGHPEFTRERETLVFIHLQKTGGMSLRAQLQKRFDADRICPVIDDNLHRLSVAELASFDLFAGHFDRSSLSFIPRDRIRTVSLLREPRARLISFYRFHRSHPVADEFADNIFVRLANELTAEEFFERNEVRSASVAFNHYVVALGRSYSWFDRHRSSLSKTDLREALEHAKQTVRALTALGITERFEQSIELISESLQLSPPLSIDSVNVTDNSPIVDRRFRRVDPVAITPRLTAALEDLTAYDDELYGYAVGDFERRWAEFKRPLEHPT